MRIVGRPAARWQAPLLVNAGSLGSSGLEMPLFAQQTDSAEMIGRSLEQLLGVLRVMGDS